MSESSTSDGSSSLSTSTTLPSTSDTANGGNNNDGNDDNEGGIPMTSYYFVFLMLMLCVIGIVIFLNFRRRRKRRLMMLHGYSGAAVPGQQARGRYWPGRWGSANVSREEGLNENGEAPPPYMPKSTATAQADEERGEAGPAVPMQTLRRDDAGLPGYEEAASSSGGRDGDDVMRPRAPPPR